MIINHYSLGIKSEVVNWVYIIKQTFNNSKKAFSSFFTVTNTPVQHSTASMLAFVVLNTCTCHRKKRQRQIANFVSLYGHGSTKKICEVI